MYPSESQAELANKLDYELWLLDYLSNTKSFLGGSDLSTITMWNRNRSKGQTVEIGLREVLGSKATHDILEAISPLTFTSMYKTLDSIFEWILEENKESRIITCSRDISWLKFSEKIGLTKENLEVLRLPNLMRESPYLFDYLLSLYEKMLKFRNEIVHRQNFRVQNGSLKVDSAERSVTYRLELNLSEIGYLVRVVITAAKCLAGLLTFDKQIEVLVKFSLDRIQKLHEMALFNAQEPRIVNVILKIQADDNAQFIADLDFVRNNLSSTYSGFSIFFNLRAEGLEDDSVSAVWNIPYDQVPSIHEINMNDPSLSRFRISS
ncbi:MAG: hypothetical protein PXY39_11850 [archaeon]|nr:hypothetical protein [archaeon]